MLPCSRSEIDRLAADDEELWLIIVAVPKLTKVVAVICAVLNVIFAGSGTILAGLVPDKIVKV